MKNNVFFIGMSVIVLGAIANGCEVNPFSPPDKAKPPTETSSSSNASSGGGSGGGASSSSGEPSSSSSSSSGMGGTGGMGSGGSAGSGGAGGGCVCTDDNNACTTDVSGNCPNGDPMACHAVNFAASCPTGVCNDKAECVDCLACAEAACVDRCNGIGCGMPTECKSGKCEQATCCNATCTGPCRACDRPGVQGSCTRMANGLQVPGCNMNMVCDNAGACVAQTKAALGALCTTNNDCQSNVCRREYCQSAVGQPCVENLECDSNLCDPTTKTCKGCTDNAMCPAGATCDTVAQRCQVFLGQPASNTAECSKGTLVQFLCALPVGAACNNHYECIGRNCMGGVCTQQCATAAECMNGGPCNAGVCGMDAGNYCMINAQCKSGMCGGFPRKCL
jgi:hypothetical protein